VAFRKKISIEVLQQFGKARPKVARAKLQVLSLMSRQLKG